MTIASNNALTGGVSEWSMVTVLKTVAPLYGAVGSNPTPSATSLEYLPIFN